MKDWDDVKAFEALLQVGRMIYYDQNSGKSTKVENRAEVGESLLREPFNADGSGIRKPKDFNS